jgi:hypothetical protein
MHGGTIEGLQSAVKRKYREQGWEKSTDHNSFVTAHLMIYESGADLVPFPKSLKSIRLSPFSDIERPCCRAGTPLIVEEGERAPQLT